MYVLLFAGLILVFVWLWKYVAQMFAGISNSFKTSTGAQQAPNNSKGSISAGPGSGSGGSGSGSSGGLGGLIKSLFGSSDSSSAFSDPNSPYYDPTQDPNSSSYNPLADPNSPYYEGLNNSSYDPNITDPNYNSDPLSSGDNGGGAYYNDPSLQPSDLMASDNTDNMA